MVNTVGIPTSEVVRSLELASGIRLKPEMDNTGYGQHWMGTDPKGKPVLLFVTDYGFDEAPYDESFGPGKARQTIDRLRAGL